MLVLRTVGIFIALLLLGLVGAFLATKNRRYLTMAWLAVQVIVLDSVLINWVSQPAWPKLTLVENPIGVRRLLVDEPFQKKSCCPATAEQCAAVSR